jgi:hypothetical protein
MSGRISLRWSVCMKSGRGGREEDRFYEIEILKRDFTELTY